MRRLSQNGMHGGAQSYGVHDQEKPFMIASYQRKARIGAVVFFASLAFEFVAGFVFRALGLPPPVTSADAPVPLIIMLPLLASVGAMFFGRRSTTLNWNSSR